MYIFVGLNPVAIDVSWIRLLRTKTAADVNLLNPGRPKSLDGRRGAPSITTDVEA
jgi:hypothetical protein